MSNKPRIILLHHNLSCNVPIQDRIEFENLSTEVVSTLLMDEAFRAIPETGSCILITDSLIASSDLPRNKKIVEDFIRDTKAKKPNCKTILYAFDYLKLDTKLFDYAIPLGSGDDFELLFEKLKELSNQN